MIYPKLTDGYIYNGLKIIPSRARESAQWLRVLAMQSLRLESRSQLPHSETDVQSLPITPTGASLELAGFQSSRNNANLSSGRHSISEE